MGKWAITAFYVLATLHIPVSHVTHMPIQWVAGLVCIIAIIAELNLATAPAHIFFLFYLAMVAISAAHSISGLPPADVLMASMSYVVMPGIFLAGLARDPSGKIGAISRANIWIALISAAAAAYQLYVDPLLLGIYAGTSYESLESWASPRASGLQGSPQVLSAYMVFSVIMYDVFENKSRLRDFAFFGVLMAGAVLSGSVASIAGIGCYFIVKSIVRRPVLLVVWPIVGGAFYGLLRFINSSGWEIGRGPAARFLSVLDGGLGNSERIDRWVSAFNATPFLWGNGIGSASTLVGGAARFNTESYLLGLYYEGGFVLVAGFAVILIRACMAHVAERTADKWGFLAAFVFTAAIVHAFYATALPIVWVLLFGFINLGQRRVVTYLAAPEAYGSALKA